MPFTVSHAAAALPFLRVPLLGSTVGRTSFVPAALVIGTMAPDLPYFVPGPTGRTLTHTLTGVVTVDLAIGIAVLALWVWVVRAPTIDLAPEWLRTRLSPPERRHAPHRAAAETARTATEVGQTATETARTAAVLVAALIVGTLTHLAWDFFTHPGALEDAVPFFATQLGPLTVTKWFQHGSSVFGLIMLAIFAVRWVRRTPPTEQHARWGRVWRITAWACIIATFVVVALLVWWGGVASGYALLDPALVFHIARRSIGAALLVSAVIVVVWHGVRIFTRKKV